MLVAVLDELLRRRFILASPGSAAFNPSTLAYKFKISVNETTPDNLPIIKFGGIDPRGGAVGCTTCDVEGVDGYNGKCGVNGVDGAVLDADEEPEGIGETVPDG